MMTDYTDEQLAERLAVEVCGWHLIKYTDYPDLNAFYDDDFNMMSYRKDWKPWLNLRQAWIVKQELIKAETLFNFDSPTLHKLFYEGVLAVLDEPQAARAIFDAAVKALNLNSVLVNIDENSPVMPNNKEI